MRSPALGSLTFGRETARRMPWRTICAFCAFHTAAQGVFARSDAENAAGPRRRAVPAPQGIAPRKREKIS